jgi:lysozyme family protein
MNQLKHEIITEILRVEGGYVNDPADSGGETNFGITVSVARSCGYPGAMRDMSRDVAYDIYAMRYWDAVRADDLMTVSRRIAGEVVDTGVNVGVHRAGTFLQRVLNVLNDRGRLYEDIGVDGHIGSKTIAALRACVALRGVNVVHLALNCLQGAYYIELAERREKDERFIRGWLEQRVRL